MQPAFSNIQFDEIAVTNQSERPTSRRFGHTCRTTVP